MDKIYFYIDSGELIELPLSEVEYIGHNDSCVEVRKDDYHYWYPRVVCFSKEMLEKWKGI